jgi:hypothetical protein
MSCRGPDVEPNNGGLGKAYKYVQNYTLPTLGYIIKSSPTLPLSAMSLSMNPSPMEHINTNRELAGFFMY